MIDQEQPASLAEALSRYDQAYLLTASAHGGPHATAVEPRLQGNVLHVAELGQHSLKNVAVRPNVTVLWPPRVASDYALIVDGDGTVADGNLTIAPTRAVLTRSAPSPHPALAGGCLSDCIELDFGAPAQPPKVARTA